MIRLLDRLVLGSFLKLFVVSILATPPLFILGDVTENIAGHVDAGVAGLQLVRGYLFTLPQFVVWSFPIAALIATVFTIHGMTAHREVVAAKAGGISFHRLVLPIVLAGVALTGAALVLTEVAPRTNRISTQILENQDPRRGWRNDFVFQTETGMALAARRVTVDDGRMQDIVIEGRPGTMGTWVRMESQAAMWDADVGWTLLDGRYRRIHPEGTVSTLRFEELQLPGLTERPDDLLETPPEEEEMTYAEISRLARIIERSGGDPGELLVKKEQKLAIPFATFVIIVFGAPLATSSRRGGAAYGVGIALGTTIVYQLMFKIAAGFGAGGAIRPELAAWLPNVLFLVTGIVLMTRVRT